jgi:hypothetical protein
MRHGRSFHQHFELRSQWLTITIIVCISPLAMTQDAVLKFGSSPHRPHLVFDRMPGRICSQGMIKD